MNISILSVAPPYRGGIAEQTYQLFLQLNKNHKVSIINFSRQYPELLFPGKSQYDEESKLKDIDENFRIVDTINPFSWRRSADLIIRHSPELLILRFWNPFFAISYGRILRRVRKKLPHLKVIGICDNIIPHEQSAFDKLLISYLFKNIDGFIVMSPQVESELKTILKDPKYDRVFHPIANKKIEISKTEARSNLNVKHEKLIMFFGLIRNYKGLETLLEANQYLNDKLDDYSIVICGECYEDEKKYIQLIKDFSYRDEIKWINEYIPDELAANYFMASDMTVLPYKSASQSGVIPLSYSYGSPVIASRISGIKEMVDEGRTGYLFEKEDAKDLANKIIEFYSSNVDYTKNIKDFRQKYDWSNFINKLFHLFDSVR